MRGIIAACLCLAAVLAGTTTEAAADSGKGIEIRGVIEGFYGRPWTTEERLDQFVFYGRQGLNTYIYAPKDDPYHRSKWRDPYPPAAMADLRRLIAEARQNNVDFVFALSPGLDLRFGGAAGEQDIEAVMTKFSSLYDMGVRSFALFFDDIEHKDGVGQAQVLNEVNRRFIRVKPGIRHFFTVPTEYFTADMLADGLLKRYTENFAKNLDEDIIVLYTGPGVVCDGITAGDIEKVRAIYGRKLGVWWNYPVNDYLLPKLALGPVTGLGPEAGQSMRAFIMNPMEHPGLSKISLATGAAYAANPAAYEEETAWKQAIGDQYGALAPAMEVFASHSQRMEKRWAHAGREDAPLVRRHMEELFVQLERNSDIAWPAALLKRDFEDMEQAAGELEAKLPENLRQECAPQLRLCRQLAQADLTALAMLEAKAAGQPYLYRCLRQLLLQQKAALPVPATVRLSEKAAGAFIDAVLAQQPAASDKK